MPISNGVESSSRSSPSVRAMNSSRATSPVNGGGSKRSELRIPAVDDERLAGVIVRRVAGEIDRDAAEVLRLAPAAHGTRGMTFSAKTGLPARPRSCRSRSSRARSSSRARRSGQARPRARAPSTSPRPWSRRRPSCARRLRCRRCSRPRPASRSRRRSWRGRPCACAASRKVQNTPSSLTACTRRKSSVVISVIGAPPPMPALATTQSTRPISAIAAFMPSITSCFARRR